MMMMMLFMNHDDDIVDEEGGDVDYDGFDQNQPQCNSAWTNERLFAVLGQAKTHVYHKH